MDGSTLAPTFDPDRARYVAEAARRALVLDELPNLGALAELDSLGIPMDGPYTGSLTHRLMSLRFGAWHSWARAVERELTGTDAGRRRDPILDLARNTTLPRSTRWESGARSTCP